MAGIRLADTLGCFAVAGEIGRGQPEGHVARTCALAMDIAEELGLPTDNRLDVYYTSILVHAGCTAGVSEVALFLLCDEFAVQRDICMCDPGHEMEVIRALFRHTGSSGGAAARVRSLLRLATGGEKMFREMESGCSDVGSRIASRLGLPETTCEALFHICETWNGKGPHGLEGAAIPAASTIVNTAMTLELFLAAGGTEAAEQAARQRSGKSISPDVSSAFLSACARRGGEWQRSGDWAAVLALEPSPHRFVEGDNTEALALACADMGDLKVPGSASHSRRVGALAGQVAGRLNHNLVEVTLARRAGLVHSMGSVALPAVLLADGHRPTRGEQEQIRLHPHFTRRILARSPLAEAAELSAFHHERMDGAGYPSGVNAEGLSQLARVVAAADAFDEAVMRSEGGDSESALASLARDASAAFGSDVWAAVVAEVEGRSRHDRPVPQWPAGLTEREVEVLRLAARGATVREIARQLQISPHTARHHLENVYGKAGVSSRAGAAVFAMESGLLT